MENTTAGPGFCDGVTVRLADGNEWFLPSRDPRADDPEYDALLAEAAAAEDGADARRAGLALTLALLRRRYDLGPERLRALLTFPDDDDPRLAALQAKVHRLMAAQVRRRGPGRGAVPAPRRRSHLASLREALRAPWSRRPHAPVCGRGR
jgi:hypothetical protein